MNHCKKLGMAALLLSSSLMAEEVSKDVSKADDLKTIMKGLLTETLKLTEGIIQTDYLMIEKSANKIANHPPANMATRKKLAKEFGPEMLKFKNFDSIVHTSALDILEASKEQDMVKIIGDYQKIVQGCQDCHSVFRERAVEILSKN